MTHGSGPKSPSQPPKKGRPKLKLVFSNPNPDPIPARAFTQKVIPVYWAMPPKEGFSVETANKGQQVYQMIIQDPSHYLRCALNLEVEESQGLEEGIADGTVVCHFPPIDDDLLNQFVDGDETLYGMLIIQFQMKILEALFLFCATHYASRLIIYMDDREAGKFGIYEDFLSHYGKALTPGGEKAEMALPSVPQAFDRWNDFMDKASQDFRRTLWRGQALNPVIRSYLKWDPSLQFFY